MAIAGRFLETRVRVGPYMTQGGSPLEHEPRRITVLVADDETMLQKMLCDVLAAHGFHVTVSRQRQRSPGCGCAVFRQHRSAYLRRANAGDDGAGFGAAASDIAARTESHADFGVSAGQVGAGSRLAVRSKALLTECTATRDLQHAGSVANA